MVTTITWYFVALYCVCQFYFRLFPCAVLLSVGIFVACKFSLIQHRKYIVFHLPFFIYHFTYHLTVPLFTNLTVDDFQNFPDNLLFCNCFANLVQYSVFDSEEAVVTGKLINLRYYVLHLLSNCFHLFTYCRREELLKFYIISYCTSYDSLWWLLLCS